MRAEHRAKLLADFERAACSDVLVAQAYYAYLHVEDVSLEDALMWAVNQQSARFEQWHQKFVEAELGRPKLLIVQRED